MKILITGGTGFVRSAVVRRAVRGHNFRYAIDAAKLDSDFGWTPRMPLDDGLEQTVRWYVENGGWLKRIRERGFRSERLGLVEAS